jgi:hypothetical protein
MRTIKPQIDHSSEEGWGEFIWMQRDTDIPLIGQAEKAYHLIVNEFILACNGSNIPCEFVYCPASNTSNITFPKKLLDVAWGIIFKDANFKEKTIPLIDAMAQAELKEALLAGSNFSKHWH